MLSIVNNPVLPQLALAIGVRSFLIKTNSSPVNKSNAGLVLKFAAEFDVLQLELLKFLSKFSYLRSQHTLRVKICLNCYLQDCSTEQ